MKPRKAVTRLAFVLALGGCGWNTQQQHRCPIPRTQHLHVGKAYRMSLKVSARLPGDYVFFDDRTWALTSPSQGTFIARKLAGVKGSLTLWTHDVAIFRTSDGRTFAFAPQGLGCA
jgi:hypothetical protein